MYRICPFFFVFCFGFFVFSASICSTMVEINTFQNMTSVHPEPSGTPCWLILLRFLIPILPPSFISFMFQWSMLGLSTSTSILYKFGTEHLLTCRTIYSEPRGSPYRTPQVHYICHPLQLHHHHHLPVSFPPAFFSLLLLFSFLFFFLLLWDSWHFIFSYFGLNLFFTLVVLCFLSFWSLFSISGLWPQQNHLVWNLLRSWLIFLTQTAHTATLHWAK